MSNTNIKVERYEELLKTEINAKYLLESVKGLENKFDRTKEILLETNFKNMYIDKPLEEFLKVSEYTFGLRNIENIIEVVSIQEIREFLTMKWNEYHAESQEVSEDE